MRRTSSVRQIPRQIQKLAALRAAPTPRHGPHPATVGSRSPIPDQPDGVERRPQRGVHRRRPPNQSLRLTVVLDPATPRTELRVDQQPDPLRTRRPIVINPLRLGPNTSLDRGFIGAIRLRRFGIPVVSESSEFNTPERRADAGQPVRTVAPRPAVSAAYLRVQCGKDLGHTSFHLRFPSHEPSIAARAASSN